MPDKRSSMGWWTICGEDLLDLMRRAAAGEDPNMLYAEAYANSDVSRPADEG